MASEEKDANAIKSGNISSSIRLGVHVVEDEYNSDENMDVLYTANRDGRNSEEVNFHFEATNVAPCAAGGDDGEGEEQVDIFRLIGGDVSEEESDYDEHISEEEDEEKMKEYSLRDMGTGVEDDIRGSSGEEEMAVDAEESGQADGRNDALEVPSDGGLNFSTMIPVEKKEVSGQRYFPLASFMEEEEEEEDSLTGEETKSSRQIVRAPLLAQASSKSRGDTAKTNGDCEADVLFGFVLDNVLSSEECAALIDTAEMISDDEDVADCSFTFWNKDCKTEAEVSASRAYRNVDTIEFCHSPFAVELWRRIAPFLTKEYARIDLTKGGASGDPRWQPDVAGVWEAFGTNEHLLLGRYGSGGHFAPHTDGYNIVDFNTRSMLSIVLYLNECASGGGDTRFYSDRLRSQLKQDDHGRWTGVTSGLEIATVKPKPGRAVLFFHNHMHEGVPPSRGSRKYIIRSDVMYRRIPPICTKPEDIEAYKLYVRANSCKSPKEAQALFERCFKMSPALAEVFGM